MFADDNLPANANGPTGDYAYLTAFPTLNTQTDEWFFELDMKVLTGNGAANGVFQAYDSDGTGRWLLFVYEDGAGNLVANDLSSPTWNLGLNDGAYHDYRMASDGAGNVNLLFDGADQGTVNFRAADTPGGLGVRLSVGSGSTGATGQWNLAQAEFGIVPEPFSATLLGLSGLALFLRRRK